MKIPTSNSFRIITFFLLLVLATTSVQNPRCPFYFLYVIGDGSTDIGNAVRLSPFGSDLRANRYPYGITYPGRPNGRWSDGLNDADYTTRGLGLPYTVEFLSRNRSTSTYDALVFATEGSTIHDHSYFASRRINVPLSNIPLFAQINWYRDYTNSNPCTNSRECWNRQPSNSLVALKHIEANDMRYALLQGKSIQEVTTYVPSMVQYQLGAARTVIELGATRVVYATATPLGCSPDMLTALSSNDPTAYDELGCLTAVNNVIVSYNNGLNAAFNSLRSEYPSVIILGADIYNATLTYINETSVRGSSGNLALRACCGIGGRYNFDSQRLCGSPNVPVCPNPNDYVYWDGVHLTQEAYRRIINKLLPTAFTTRKTAFSDDSFCHYI